MRLPPAEASTLLLVALVPTLFVMGLYALVRPSALRDQHLRARARLRNVPVVGQFAGRPTRFVSSRWYLAYLRLLGLASVIMAILLGVSLVLRLLDSAT